MDEVNLKEYLLNCSEEELTTSLTKLDASIMALHHAGYYVVGFDANNIKVYDGEFSLASFNDKIDYLDSGINTHGDKKDILEMCAIGICAYNKFSSFYINKEFISYLISNFDTFAHNGKIPPEMIEYYRSVLVDGEIDYLNNYLYKKQNTNASDNQVLGNTNRLTKSTAIGRAFSEREAAYVNVLLLPAVVVLILVIIFTLFIVFGGLQ